MGRLIRLEGQRFGLLTVISRAGRFHRTTAWLCRCDCGREVRSRQDRLRSGQRQTCGKNHPHLLTTLSLRALFPSEFRSFACMHKRCTARKHKNWKRYGGREISVCPEWKSFATFLGDMGEKPTPRHTIDRIDNNRGYEPGNCRWATYREQGRNMRNNIYVEHEGQRVLLLDLCDELNLNPGNIRTRLSLGWNLERALTTPIRPKAKKKIVSSLQL